jgi:dihydrofolate reductase (trimethoprim resistance protein)
MSDRTEYAAQEVRSKRVWPQTHRSFAYGDGVAKISGSDWSGRIVGWYATELTPEGYAVESAWHKGAVQIYPAAALRKIGA